MVSLLVKVHVGYQLSLKHFYKLTFLSIQQHFHQLAKENQLSNELRLNGGDEDGVGGVAAAAEHMTLTGGESQTLSFDD